MSTEPTSERIAEIRKAHDTGHDERFANLIVGDLLEWVDSLTRQRDEAQTAYARVDKAVSGLRGFDMLPAMDVRIALNGGPTWDEYEHGLDAGRSWRGVVSMDEVSPAALDGVGTPTPTAPPETEDVDLSKTQQWTEKTFRLDLEHPDSSIPILPDEDFECCSAPPETPGAPSDLTPPRMGTVGWLSDRLQGLPVDMDVIVHGPDNYWPLGEDTGDDDVCDGERIFRIMIDEVGDDAVPATPVEEDRP